MLLIMIYFSLLTVYVFKNFFEIYLNTIHTIHNFYPNFRFQ